MPSRLCVPGVLDSLENISHYVQQVAARAGLGKKAAYGLRLAVDEIATNIITHGYLEAGRMGEVCLQASADGQAVTMVLEDRGVPFDPSGCERQEQARVQEPLEGRPIGGLGLLLAIDGVDRFRYERAGGLNRNILTVSLGNPS